jgi:hypothetical protein
MFIIHISVTCTPAAAVLVMIVVMMGIANEI